MNLFAVPASRSRGALRIGLALALGLGATGLAVGAVAPAAGGVSAAVSRDALDVVTTIQLDLTILGAVGLEVVAVEPSATGRASHPLSFVAADAPSFAAVEARSLRLSIGRDGTLRGFAGALRHRGGFRLNGPSGVYDFAEVVLRPGRRPATLELVDTTGRALLTTAGAQWELDAEGGRLRYVNADLRILPALARRLGDERLTNVTVGALALDA